MSSQLLPQIVVLAVPAPFLILLLVIGLYHLTPLLALLPNIHLVPLLHRLSTTIPRPKRNLPREFFNLPPRPCSPSSHLTLEELRVLSVRGKVILLLTGHAVLSLACGWAFLATGTTRWALAAVGSTALPAALASLVAFSVIRPPSGRAAWTNGGGITHSTVFARILPASVVPVIIGAVAAATSGDIAPLVVLAFSGALVMVIVVGSAIGGYHTFVKPRRGPIRLAGATDESMEDSGEAEDWLTEPSQPSTIPVSAFSFSPTPSFKTPDHRRNRQRPPHTNDESWVSSPTDTPNTLPSWEFSPVTSPQVALTRQRSHSPIPQGLPRPIQPTSARRGKASQATTAGDRTMTTLTSPGGSILGGYEPDPAYPMPRRFASLSAYPLSPAQLDAGAERTRAAGRSGDTIAFIPEEKESEDPRESTWTLETYYSATDAPFTPGRPGSATPGRGSATPGRRAPPPPPMPVDMPLPPTPTAARSETAVEWGPHAKESREFLIGEREWVEVDPDVDGLDDWSRQGRGVGVVALLAVVASFALSTPLLASDITRMTETLYLVSLILPAPIIALASYMLRYRPSKTIRERIKKASIKSNSTHRSLALSAPSSLSLPASLAPHLTPPNEKRVIEPNARLSHFLDPKPSVSNFGYDRHANARPHTVYGTDDARDQLAEEALRKNMNRRSGDVWLEMDHAVEAGSRFSRTAEMLKRNPALQVMDHRPASDGMLKRLRGGVVSMLPKRLSGMVDHARIDQVRSEEYGYAPHSPIAISVTSPSKFEKHRTSAMSDITHEGDTEEGMTTLPSVEIQTATKGRMSSSPIFFCGRPGSAAVVRGEDGYELDWMTAGVLPGLVPSIRIGKDVKVGPRPSDISARRVSQPVANEVTRISSLRDSSSMSTPARRGHVRGLSSSVDFGTPPDFEGAIGSTPHHSGMRNRLKHKKSFSLPIVNPADFADLQQSFDDCGKNDSTPRRAGDGDTGVDLPPIPRSYANRDLSRVTERDEANESTLMRETMNDMGQAILALSSSPASSARAGDTADASDVSSRMNLSDLAPIILHGANLNASYSSSLRSSVEELMAEEMEAVMAMDTHTRAEFVISPPPSSYASSIGGRDSRASLRTTKSRMSMEDVPPVPHGRFSTGWTTTTGDHTTSDQFDDADEPLPPPVQDVSVDMSELDSGSGGGPLHHASSMPSMAYSHPHPPPIYTTPSIPNFSRPGAGMVAPTDAHPPVPIKELHKLRSRKSNETMASTHSTTTTDYESSPYRTTEQFQLSRQERAQLEQLKARKIHMDQQKARSKSAMGHRDQEKADNMEHVQSRPKSALKPLQLVERNENRMSMPLPRPKHRTSIYTDATHAAAQEKGSTASRTQEEARQGKVSKMSVASTGSGKENHGRIAKGSKASTGSAPRVLRA